MLRFSSSYNADHQLHHRPLLVGPPQQFVTNTSFLVNQADPTFPKQVLLDVSKPVDVHTSFLPNIITFSGSWSCPHWIVDTSGQNYCWSPTSR